MAKLIIAAIHPDDATVIEYAGKYNDVGDWTELDSYEHGHKAVEFKQYVLLEVE